MFCRNEGTNKKTDILLLSGGDGNKQKDRHSITLGGRLLGDLIFEYLCERGW